MPAHTPRAGTQAEASGGSRPFKRTYKACETCRVTKSKCERDDGPQCLKCRREQRDCVFPPQRSTKRTKLNNSITVANTGNNNHSSAPNNTGVLDQAQTSSNPQNRSKRRPARSAGAQPVHDSQHNRSPTKHPNEAQGLFGTTRQLDTQSVDASLLSPFNQATPSRRADTLQEQVVKAVVDNPRDAVGLLFRTADGSESTDITGTAGDHPNSNDGPRKLPNQVYTPSVINHEVPSQVLDLWSHHRFVRQGWFTEREAVGYILDFFTNIAPLSPVLEPFQNDFASHRRLVVEEPLLCCTILMISSRHHPPPGPGGVIRADFIHGRLWRHIEHLLQRVTLGAEKYSVAKSRTLGTIQALLLITDWNPRSLHFPPETDGWDASLAPSVDDTFTPHSLSNEASRRWREDVFEPAKRSDRLSWMLTGIATTLAHELGVFKRVEDDEQPSETLRPSTLRIRRLLYIYTTQLALRLGCTNVFPQEALLDVLQPSGSSVFRPNSEDELALAKWIDITKMLSTAADMFFESPAGTKRLLRSTRHLTLLNHFKPLMDSWYREYRLYYTNPGPPQKILLVDYYYVRMYIHSITMQALVSQIHDVSEGLDLWHSREIWRSKHSQGFASVNEVRESSCQILAIAVELSQANILQHCPVRLFLRVVCASVFLLKALSLGSREADIATSLDILDQATTALQMNSTDDIHLSGRYSTLIARHVQRFRQNFRVHKSASHLTSPTRTRQPSPSRDRAATDEQGPTEPHNLPPADQNQNSAARVQAQQDFVDFLDMANDDDTDFWMAQPFDPQVAPFGMEYMDSGVGLAADSLDFLWNV